MIVILDNIRSVYNVGSIFRTADAAGVKKIYLCGITPSPVDRFGLKNKALVKVALGAQDYIKWEKAESAAGAVKKLKQRGYKILAIEQDKKAVSIFNFKVNSKFAYALVMGAEIGGLPPALLKMADAILEIPMRGEKESLNVSVAFGVAAYYLSPLFKARNLLNAEKTS